MPSIPFESINYLAVLAAGFAAFMLGGVWYTALFGKAWQRAHGFTEEAVKQAQASMNPAVFFGGMFLCYLVVALGMAVLMEWTPTASLSGGAVLGLLVGTLIVAPITLTNHLPSMVKPAGFLIDVVYELLYLTIIGAILGAWQ